MTFREFCIYGTIFGVGTIAILSLILMAFHYKANGNMRDWWDSASSFIFAPLVVASLVMVICWIVYASAYAGEVKDRNYCEMFEEVRGIDSEFVRYNQFNRDCFIKAEGQWVRIEDSAWGRNG